MTPYAAIQIQHKIILLHFSRAFNTVYLIYLCLNSIDGDATITVNHLYWQTAIYIFKYNLKIKLTLNIVDRLIYLIC